MFFSKEKRAPQTSTIAMMDSRIKETYMEDEIEKIKEEDLEEVLDNEEKISKKLHKVRPLRRFVNIGKVMFEMLWDIKNGKYKETPWFTIATVVVMFLYILNPLDLVPDFIPGLGYLDDLAIMTIGLGWIETDLHKYLDWRLEREENC